MLHPCNNTPTITRTTLAFVWKPMCKNRTLLEWFQMTSMSFFFVFSHFTPQKKNHMTESRNLLKKGQKGTRWDQQPVQHCGRKNSIKSKGWGPSFGIIGGKDSSVSLQSYKIIIKKTLKINSLETGHSGPTYFYMWPGHAHIAQFDSEMWFLWFRSCF